MRLFHLTWFFIPAAIIAICIGLITFNWSTIRAEYALWDSTQTKNPSYFYWPTAQALRELETARLDLKTIADGFTVEPDSITFDRDVLISGINIIVRSSDLNDGYKMLPGFSREGAALAAFAADVLPQMVPGISSADAEMLLSKVEDISENLNIISKLAWDQDTKLKEKSFETIQAGHRVILIISGLFICALLCFFLISLFYWWAIIAKTRALAIAEAAVADKVDFLAMVSHELRTPLQVIVSALDVLETPQDFQTRKELTGRIRRSANSLAVQLRDMLTLARAQAGYIELQPGVFDARELTREVVDDYLAAAQSKDLGLHYTGPDDAMFVFADGERIAQLLHNLVSNAVKYSPTGFVRICLAPFETVTGELRLRVEDSGPGLPPKVLEHSTDVKGLSSLGSGRGVGLSVVQTLLRQLGARMTISSPATGGSLFDLAIPAVLAGEHPNHGADDSRKRVLVVDDHPDLLEGLANVLEDLGFAADVAASGMRALNFLAAHAYSVILIDLDMPVMSGSDLAAHIRKTEISPNFKLVAMSAAAHGPKYDLSCFDAILHKPIRRHQLLTIMQF